MSEPVHVTIWTSEGEQKLPVESGGSDVRLSKWMKQRGRPLNTRCGGQGLCDGCLVELVAGRLRRRADGAAVTAPGPLRACEHTLIEHEPATLRVPDRSLVALAPQVIADFRLEVPIGRAPLWPGSGTAADLADPVAAAVDIGTTTVAVLLIDLSSGAVLARSSAFNRQTHLGDDVLTRINLCMTDPTALEQLHEAVVNETLATLLTEALAEAGVEAQRLVCVSVAANTTMLHLLVSEDPSTMGIAPFTPQFLEHRVTTLGQIGLRWPAPATAPKRDAEVHLLPGAAAYVGADLTAGIVATGMRYHSGNILLVDVGTNGEIILKHGDQLLGCATAAGPAFEGSRLSCGVRAVQGAISHLDITPDPLAIHVEIIGAQPDAKRRPQPIGLCGSAYVDLLAQGAASGVLRPAGRFNVDLPGIADRLVESGSRRMLQLAKGPGREPVGVTEGDVASLLQAKAAIAAGIITLLQRAGLTAQDIDTLYLAGGFGLHLRVPSAIGCGMLPGFRPEQVRLVGNTSLAGAFMAAMDQAVLEEMRQAAAGMEIVELNLDPAFEMNFIDHLSLPEPGAPDAEPG